MRVLGIDFTSAPTRAKPIVCLSAVLTRGVLQPRDLAEWSSFGEFEQALRARGPWVAGLDFPFGQSRQFIETIGWPRTWTRYVQHAHDLGRDGFRRALEAYRAGRPAGDKEHRRATDRQAGAISPQKLHFPPVGLMFFEGAPRLIAAGVTIPGLLAGDPGRVVVEAYPGYLARKLVGRISYKHDSKPRQTSAQRAARDALLKRLRADGALADYGLCVELSAGMTQGLVNDPTGDRLDALLCAIQAGWAWKRRRDGFGAPRTLDLLEGWIADPDLRTHQRRRLMRSSGPGDNGLFAPK
jgi:hypothetical protein